jgi:hypothetical protein
MNIILREFLPDDKNFILTTMIKSSYEDTTGKKERFSIYHDGLSNCLINKFQSGEINILVACTDDDPSFIVGYAIYDLNYTLHYVLVKMAFRRMGIANMILDKIFKTKKNITVSFYTKDLRFLLNKYNLEYDRFKFYK